MAFDANLSRRVDRNVLWSESSRWWLRLLARLEWLFVLRWRVP